VRSLAGKAEQKLQHFTRAFRTADLTSARGPTGRVGRQKRPSYAFP
jgi:hypothetical protein